MMHFERGPVGEAVNKTIAEVMATAEFKKKLDEEIKAALEKELPLIVEKMVKDKLQTAIEHAFYGAQNPVTVRAEEYIKGYLASDMGTDIRARMDAAATEAIKDSDTVKRAVRETFAKELYALARESVDKAVRNREGKESKAKKKKS